MSKLTLNDITSGYASTTLLNSNNAAIEAALENTLSRDGTGPNSMSADLDMNGHAILNQRATSGNENFIWAGAWTTGTIYQQNNLIYASEGTYLGYGLICITTHTSGATLDGDLANWDVYVEKGATVGGLTGPASSTNNYLSQWNGTSGTALKEGVPIGATGGVQAYSTNLTTLATKTFIDEDTMVSDLDTAIPSQQSVKAYVDNVIVNAGTATPDISADYFLFEDATDNTQKKALISSLGSLTLATAQATTSGTYKDFLSIPPDVKQITVMLNGVSHGGTSVLLIQLGAAGVPITTGYKSYGEGMDGASMTAVAFTTGFGLTDVYAAARAFHGQVVLTHMGSNVWTASGSGAQVGDVVEGATCGGSVTLTGTLDMIRLTSVSGDTFDAGSVNILYV